MEKKSLVSLLLIVFLGFFVSAQVVDEGIFIGSPEGAEGAEVGENCVIASIEWDSISANSGDVIYYTAQGEGCDGSIVPLTIFEDDIFSNDVLDLSADAFFIDGVASGSVYLNPSILDSEFGMFEGDLELVLELGGFTSGTLNVGEGDGGEIPGLMAVEEIVIDFSSSKGVVNEYFYGSGGLMFFGKGTTLQADKARNLWVPNDYEWNRKMFIDSGMKNIRSGMLIERMFNSDKTFVRGDNNWNRVEIVSDAVKWAYQNDLRVLFIAGYMPDWLANKSYDCSASHSCPPRDYDVWGELVVKFLDNVTDDGKYASIIDVEVWNEPDIPWFWLNDTQIYDPIKAEAYIKLYEATYDAIKARYPEIPVGGPTIARSTLGGEEILNKLFSNFPDKMDFISFHDYQGEGDDFDKIFNDKNSWLKNKCSLYKISCDKIVISEFNNYDSKIQVNDPEEYTYQLALAYSSSLNINPSGTSMIFYDWSHFNKYVETKEYPARWIMLSQPNLDNEIYVPYLLTKNFTRSHGGGSRIVSSSSIYSDVRVIASEKNNLKYVTIINGNENLRSHLTLRADGVGFLRDIQTNKVYASQNDVFNLGAFSKKEVRYFVSDLVLAPIIASINPDSIYDDATNFVKIRGTGFDVIPFSQIAINLSFGRTNLIMTNTTNPGFLNYGEDKNELVLKFDQRSYPQGDYGIRIMTRDVQGIRESNSVVLKVKARRLDSDGDGVPDSVDKCPNTATLHKNRVNAEGCPAPTINKFSPTLTTDLLKLSSLSNVGGLKIGVLNIGLIKFRDAVNLTREITSTNPKRYDPIDLDSNINISKNRIELKSDKISELNVSADLVFYSTNLTNPVLNRDGVLCKNGCMITGYSSNTKEISARVNYFSTYEVVEGKCGDGVCGITETCGSCSTDCGTCPIGTKKSPGGGGATKLPGGNTHLVNLDDFKNHSVIFTLRDDMFMIINKQRYLFNPLSVNRNIFTVEFVNTSQTFNFLLGETYPIDVFGNRDSDIELRISSITSDKIVLVASRIKIGEIIDGAKTPTIPDKIKGDAGIFSNVSWVIWLILILLVVLSGGAYYFLKQQVIKGVEGSEKSKGTPVSPGPPMTRQVLRKPLSSIPPKRVQTASHKKVFPIRPPVPQRPALHKKESSQSLPRRPGFDFNR